MIHPLYEEIIIIIGLILFGLYICISYDVFIYMNNNITKNKIKKRLYEIIFITIQLYITYQFSYKLSEGYIPIYFILFFMLSGYIYFNFIHDLIIKILNPIIKIINKMLPIIKKIILNLFINKEAIQIIKNIKINKINKKQKKLEKEINICHLN